MSSSTQTKFYFVPKERVANGLGIQFDVGKNGALVYEWWKEGGFWVPDPYQINITLYDYPLPEIAVQTPNAKGVFGKIGTRAVIYENNMASDVESMFRKISEWEI